MHLLPDTTGRGGKSSDLPGSRANIELAQAVAEEGDDWYSDSQFESP